jgi:hypothetical protein
MIPSHTQVVVASITNLVVETWLFYIRQILLTLTTNCTNNVVRNPNIYLFVCPFVFWSSHFLEGKKTIASKQKQT